MAPRAMVLMAILLSVMILAFVEETVAAQGSGSASSSKIQTITCSFPNTSEISPNYCNAYNEQSMDEQTTSCQDYLRNLAEAPSKNSSCCTGLNNVAYNSTACICKATFYPPSSYNASRQLLLPGLCGVTTDLCGQCPTFIISRTTTATSPAATTYTDGKSTASTVGAITLAVVFMVLLVAGIIGFSVMFYRKSKAKRNAPETFEGAPPGGSF